MSSTLVFLGIIVVIVIAAVITIIFTNSSSSRAEVSLSGLATLYFNIGTIANAQLLADSTDAAGSVIGSLTGAGTFEVIIHFSKTYSTVPKSVILTAATPLSGTPTTGYLLTVDNITTSGFEVIGYSPTAITNVHTLFYYAVV